MLWMRRNGIVVGIVTTVVALCGTGGMVGEESAHAGGFHVFGCRMPDGQVAPTDGWSESSSGIAASLQDSCAASGALVAALGDGTTHEVETDHATWIFSAPSGMTITGAALRRAADADGGWATNATYQYWLAGPENKELEADVIDQCVAEFGCPTGVGSTTTVGSPSNLITVLPGNLDTHLYANVSCGGSAKFVCPSGKGDSDGYAAVVYLYASDLTLEQSTQPTVSSVEGELATASTLSGVADLAFHAEDPGSGVYKAVFTVDGSPPGTTLIDENGGHCRDVGQATDSLPAFLYLRPCKPSLNADLPFDTSTLTDGTHHLVVSVTNAAGNSTVALDRKIATLNLPGSSPLTGSTPVAPGNALATGHAPATQNPPNGSNASPGARLSVRWSSTARTALAAPYGHTHLLRGRLTAPDGSPIGGATLQVLSTPAYQGSTPRSLASVHTSSDGSFHMLVPSSTPSSRITLTYSSHSGQPSPDITSALTLTVPASLSLRVTPTVSHVGGTIAFTGALHGSPLPRGGKQLVLEARAPGAPWRQFRVLSTLPHGRYHATYRFRLPGPITYQFRATSPHEADFPYGAGVSRVVRVGER
jgi:hypothetical protein